MGNSLRCCLACVLPCGALDLIRIVHLNGHVEEIAGPATAGEILNANPNHVLTRPCSQGVVRRILIISPNSELKRGSIYFLIPGASLSPEKKKTGNNNNNDNKNSRSKSSRKSKKWYTIADGLNCDRSLIAGRNSLRHDRRRSGRAGVWRPHLQSISED